jgi:putative heme-binding domain-containing protein
MALASNPSKPLAARVAALYGVSQRTVNAPDLSIINTVAALAGDATMQPYVLLALGDCGLGAKQQSDSRVPASLFIAGMKSADPQTRLNAVIAASRQRITAVAPQIAALLGDSDEVIGHTVQRALAMLDTPDVCFARVDDPNASSNVRDKALRSLRMMHTQQVVDGLIKRLAATTGDSRRGILSALCRLHFIEGKWEGSSWGTRPDYRGPYYQPDPWSETDKIAGVLKATLAVAPPEEAAFLVGELNSNRIHFNEALQRILTLAKSDPKVLPDLATQLAGADAIPGDAVPLLIHVAQSKEFSPAVISYAITALAKVDSAEGARVSLEGLVRLAGISAGSKERDAGRNAFLSAPKLENHHQIFEDIAEKMEGKVAIWADAALLTLSARKTGAPEARELSAKALEAGWQSPKRRAQIIRAAGEIKHNPYADKILSALDDPDKAVADEAKSAAGKMRLTKITKDSGPLIGTMQVKDVIAQVLNTKGEAALGEQLFTRQTCIACHTVSQDQAQKGPYLGNIAQTYNRADLAENILDPNKTIAQGFTTNLFTLKNGEVNLGFVVREGADKVTVRNAAAQEATYDVKDIAKRETLPTSIMPYGLVNSLTVREFASLLDYLAALAAKK